MILLSAQLSDSVNVFSNLLLCACAYEDMYVWRRSLQRLQEDVRPLELKLQTPLDVQQVCFTVEPSLQFWLSFYIRSSFPEIISIGFLLQRQMLRQGDFLVTPSFGDNGELSLRSENDDSNGVIFTVNQHLREVENLRVKVDFISQQVQTFSDAWVSSLFWKSKCPAFCLNVFSEAGFLTWKLNAVLYDCEGSSFQ